MPRTKKTFKRVLTEKEKNMFRKPFSQLKANAKLALEKLDEAIMHVTIKRQIEYKRLVEIEKMIRRCEAGDGYGMRECFNEANRLRNKSQAIKL